MVAVPAISYANERRVVITGIGVIAANGLNVETFWDTVRRGVTGVKPTTRYDVSNLPVKVSGEIHGFRIEEYVEAVKLRRLELSVQYGLAAAAGAVRDSKLDIAEINPDRVGIVEGTTTSGFSNVLNVQSQMVGRKKIHPYNAIGGYCGEGSSAIGIYLGIHGHALTYCSGCASGADAIGYAWRTVKDDDLDIMIAGGSDAMFEAQYFGFCRLRAMSELDGPPGTQMRPFDTTRDGFVLGEGAAYFVVEELGHALGRGATIYAEIVAHGRSAESYHPTDPHPDGLGYVNAMRRALRRAGMHGPEVDYINAHGSATPLNDPLETKAIKTVLGSHAARVGISATKPITGHTMGSSGAIEAAVCALAIQKQEMPPTINLKTPADGCDLDYLPGGARPYPVDVAMNLNAGFGGRYACLILRRWREA
jgi:3-oxoacyl-[acyl-carrier-protein] synthase II